MAWGGAPWGPKLVHPLGMSHVVAMPHWHVLGWMIGWKVNGNPSFAHVIL